MTITMISTSTDSCYQVSGDEGRFQLGPSPKRLQSPKLYLKDSGASCCWSFLRPLAVRIVITLKTIIIIRIEARLLVKVFGLRACPLPSRQGTCLLVLQEGRSSGFPFKDLREVSFVPLGFVPLGLGP